jgi:hypothetical protein
MDLFVSCPSRGLNQANLGQAQFRSSRLGIYSTFKFAVPASVRQALAGATFSDLTFNLKLHAPGRPSNTPTYTFDNLRVLSPSSPPPGAGKSVDLVALLAYSPPLSTPGVASFPVGIVQVPQSFHVKLGKSGSGKAQLDLGYGGTPSITCTYAAASGGTSYALVSCTGLAQVGDLVAADFARLTILGGDASAGTTKIRAQLALNPVGDTIGGGVLPPMPTFWGDTPDSASAIVTSYFDAVNAASTKSEERWISAPVPEFARRLGDGSPHDNLTGPPPPNDPPFDKEGHLNPGSNWDAYWRLAGNLSADNSGNRAKAHFEAALSGHAVVWGNDISVVSLQSTVDTDNGEVSSSGFNHPSASGSLHMYLFGAEIPGGGSASPSTGFNFTAGTSQNFDLPPIHIWIFSITIGVNASASVTADGSLSFGGFSLDVVPQASVGAHLEGGVDIVVASGGVSATIDLLKVSTPMKAMANWVVSTDPGACNASLSFTLDGKLTLSTLGGHVDLVAKFGICPFCDHESWTLFSWDPIDLGTQSLFHSEVSGQIFTLPGPLCVVPLQVTITKPAAGSTLTGGVPTSLIGKAVRPATAGTGGGLNLPSDVACSALTWTSSDPSDIGFPATGCTPQVTFGTPGARTVTLSATDSFGETGAATSTFTVGAAPAGPVAFITEPVSDVFTVNGLPITFKGGSVGGTGTVELTWTLTRGSTTTELGKNVPTITWSPLEGDSTITLTAEDSAHLKSSASINVEYTIIK